ncbi:LysM peptidoglycan-binding domain-containing protein [Winogradskyella sp.]|uniref:LysM peptidoglycan-binding domain-containing protein n=1 Tax=Winogradskyella sp. TaxID=1883156 RepID=UPI0025CFD187|nr:LysM peptidoglycan-binding domain-containing protein [Winogradskyella sp.]
MQKNYRLIVSIIALVISSLGAFAQSEVEYRDVVLDGKPAKLNVATGEITLVNLVEKRKVDTSIVVTDKMPEIVDSNATSDFYIVKEGENLFQIANRYNTSLTELKRVNNLETTLINKGQKLRVRNFHLQKEAELKDVASDVTNKSTSNFHIVKKDETLYSLSRRYDLSLNELKNKNSLNTNLIKVGQKLRVRDFGLNNEIENISVWTVAKGDTLFSIAKKSGTSVGAIKKLNGLTSNTIMIGQILQLK